MNDYRPLIEFLKDDIRAKPFFKLSKLARKYKTTYSLVRYWHKKIHGNETRKQTK